ncbi:hypothetical protein B0T16DRAFT_188695 [Cercophora newfieldiana]|uniref:Uncharacterized protein n=1 Tax=Cercophora newfieldiana TaxID=92897 RepID=A0AA39Y0J7_9PEZI|nr:hypothetical protein B0T16DRAFT_188695 [Cercophora newfieldiana]
MMENALHSPPSGGEDPPASTPSPRTAAQSGPGIAPQDPNNGSLVLPPAANPRNTRRRSRQTSTVSINTITVRRYLPRRLHKWESPLLIVGFFILGLVCSISHCVFYASLENTIVPNSAQQENNLRVGTAMAFLAQITFTASVWQTYDQQIWRHLDRPLSMVTLNDIFGAQNSMMSYLNADFVKRFPLGYFMGLFAWSLILPPFFTPGTLFIYESTSMVVSPQMVPYLGIAHSSNGHAFSFSPSDKGDRFNFKDVVTRVFSGPRSIITLLTAATASPGEILSLPRPANHSVYTLEFYGPAVKCTKANSTTIEWIDKAIEAEIERSITATSRQVETAYHAFVPSIFPDHILSGQADVRYQSATNASNEVWMAFQRYDNGTGRNCSTSRHYQVCNLWNATYDLMLSWENDFQSVSGKAELLHEVGYPPVDRANATTEMTQHAYSAFFWALADQIVGTFGRFNETFFNVTLNNTDTRGFPLIRSPIQHNSLLGSSDLSVFFDYNEDLNIACQQPYENLTAQRQQDIDRARGRPLKDLIEELSFNATISLMHNDLLTNQTERNVTEIRDVNRYGYNPYALWIPYALASFFTLLTVSIGVIGFLTGGVKPGIKFQDVMAAVERGEIRVAPDPPSGAAEEAEGPTHRLPSTPEAPGD